MAAGMATAVPNPAIPSINPPKPQAMISTSTRLSPETDVSIFLTTSIAFVSSVRLYVNTAATISRPMGQRAMRKPSRQAVATSRGFIFQKVSPRITDSTRAMPHAL